MMTLRTVTVGALGALVVVGAVVLWPGARREPVATNAPAGPATTLTIEPFRTAEAVPAGWSSVAFAESLASRLRRVPGLTVRVGGDGFGRRDSFQLRGEVASRDGRLVIGAHLHRESEREAVWTATFWRGDAMTPDLADDLSGSVAEAVFGQVARRALTPDGGRP